MNNFYRVIFSYSGNATYQHYGKFENFLLDFIINDKLKNKFGNVVYFNPPINMMSFEKIDLSVDFIAFDDFIKRDFTKIESKKEYKVDVEKTKNDLVPSKRAIELMKNHGFTDIFTFDIVISVNNKDTIIGKITVLRCKNEFGEWITTSDEKDLIKWLNHMNKCKIRKCGCYRL